MSATATIESILAADIGSTLTHACLIDLVEGAYRFVAHAEAPTTLSAPEDDVTLGLRRAIRRIEQITQRTLLNREEELITPEGDSGEGVDAFIVTSNAAPPVRCALVGLTDDLSLDSAQRACEASNVMVTQVVRLGRRARRWETETLTALRQAPPDVVLIVGGVDAGPTQPLESAARVLAMVYADIAAERRPQVIYAANQEARRPVTDILAPLLDVRVVDNVRPSLDTETPSELQRELAAFYAQTKLTTLAGYRHLRRWCTAPVVSTSEAMGNILRYLARRNELPQGVLGVDVGGSTTHVGAARGERYDWVVGTTLGTGLGVTGVMASASVEDIERWLPVALPQQELFNRLENVRLRPYGIPQAMEDLLLTHAVLRQALLAAMRQMRRQHWYDGRSETTATTPPFDVIAARGGAIAHTLHDGLLTLALLDALQPTGLTRLVVDWASLWPQLGAVAPIVPLAAAQVLERDSFRELGTLLAPIGEARDGALALHLRITRGDGSVTEASIPAGTLRRFPLGLDEQAIVEVRPSGAFDIGLGRKGQGGRATVRGGSLGLVVDTRGRPLSLPHDPQRCRARLQEWLANLMAQEPKA
ncbi:MAG: glutamate mutase L [Chloroflexota bacterium]